MSAPVTVAFTTLGCRLNQVESQEMGALLEGRGFRVVPADGRAQVYVVNTCTVTGRADFSDRQAIRRITRAHPDALLVVTGCYAQTDPDAVAALPGVDLVVGNQEKYRLPDLLDSLVKRPRPEVTVGDVREARGVPVAPLTRIAGRSRAFVKIQDGCQHRCAFCIVPAARGGSRSQEPKVVLDQVRALAEAGYPDITLTGVDIGHYGWDLYPRTSLAALVRSLAAVPGLRWLRLSSVLPSYFTAGSRRRGHHAAGGRAAPAPAAAERERPRAAPHAPAVPHRHVPRAGRPPGRRRPGARARRRRHRRPPGGDRCGLRGDAGPGRGAAVLVPARLRLLGPRGTEAARRPGHVPAAVIRERSRRLRRLGREKSHAFRRALVGTRREVLVLDARDRRTGLRSGLTSNYVEVLFPGPEDLGRRMATIEIAEVRGDRTHGRLVEVPA